MYENGEYGPWEGGNKRNYKWMIDIINHQSSCALLFVQAQRSRVNFENLANFT
jgi:hypothetical protein